jgi:hypothetical protein
MKVEEFSALSAEKRISYTIRYEPVASREMRPRWFYILYKVDDFYVELTYDEFSKERLATDARAIPANTYKYLEDNNYYLPCIDFDGLENLFDAE